MKKINTLLCLLLCIGLLLVLAACKTAGDKTPSGETGNGETTGDAAESTAEETTEVSPEQQQKDPATPKELWNLIDNKMLSVDSYECDNILEMVMFYNGYKMVNKTTGYDIRIGHVEGDSYYYYRYLTSEMECKELEYSESFKTLEAYNDGMLFISNVRGEKIQNLCTKMTAEEYDDYSESALTDEIDMEDCTKADFKKNDDGTWTLIFEGYTKKTVKEFLDEMDIGADELGADIVDMRITFIANADYTVKEITLELIFDVEETDTAIPVCKQVQKFSKFDSAVKVLEGIDPSDYTEVDDVECLGDVEEAIDEFAASAEGSFELDIKQTTKVGSQSVDYVEKDMVTFGKVNGSYTFRIESVASGVTTTIEYKNGVQTVTMGEDSQSGAVSEDMARESILYLINTADFSKNLVTDIENKGDGVYKFAVASPNTEDYEEYFETYGIVYKSAKQDIVVTLNDGELVKIESDFYAYGELTEDGVTQNVELNQLTMMTVKKSVGGESIF